MIGKAFCYGAATIVNAIPAGKGAAFGIKLKTTAEVKFTNEPNVFEVTIKNEPKESTKLAELCARKVLEKFGLENGYGAKIVTESEIPISKGLKSSSTAANALVLACYKALSYEYSDLEIINLGIDAAIDAGVTITGAFDDACAGYFGGAIVTDNIKRKILAKYKIDKDYEVIIHVPEKKIRKAELENQKPKTIARIAELAFELARAKRVGEAMLVNGLAWSAFLNLSPEPALKALETGAFTAGLSGTGPATVILALKDDVGKIISAIDDGSQIIKTKLNDEKARCTQ